MDVLDNPVWHALTGRQELFAEGSDRARMFFPDVGVFAGLPDVVPTEAWDDLRSIVGAGQVAMLAREPLQVPSAWEPVFSVTALQMVATQVEPLDDETLSVLTSADVPEMVALVEATRPGPFAARTIELGTYLGWRHEEVLAAMAGERLRPPGYVEISAVCTDAAFRGRGLAERLVRVACGRIAASGDQAILHVASENDGAIRLYRKLGFEVRRELAILGLRSPG